MYILTSALVLAHTYIVHVLQACCPYDFHETVIIFVRFHIVTLLRITCVETRAYLHLQGLGTDDRTLVRVIVTRCEVDMVQIKHKFQSKYHKTLGSFIKVDLLQNHIVWLQSPVHILCYRQSLSWTWCLNFKYLSL